MYEGDDLVLPHESMANTSCSVKWRREFKAFISHGTQYVTKYLHLNKKLVKTGQKVKQGQQIGTVGSTGRVTGAHLHYEFLVNGVHRNPKTVKLPKSEPLPRSELAKFKPIADNFIAQLERNRELQLALK